MQERSSKLIKIIYKGSPCTPLLHLVQCFCIVSITLLYSGINSRHLIVNVCLYCVLTMFVVV